MEGEKERRGKRELFFEPWTMLTEKKTAILSTIEVKSNM
jgi:hypothetical protein